MNSKLTILLMAALVVSGCAAKGQQAISKSTEQVQLEAGIVPCTTDADCEEKNDSQVFYCEAITKAGTRCKRRVNEAGLLCKQHSKMVKEGKVVKTVKEAQSNEIKPKENL